MLLYLYGVVLTSDKAGGKKKKKREGGLKIFTVHEILLGVKIKANWMGVTSTTSSICAQCIQKSRLKT